jgi:hypothetical protein
MCQSILLYPHIWFGSLPYSTWKQEKICGRHKARWDDLALQNCYLETNRRGEVGMHLKKYIVRTQQGVMWTGQYIQIQKIIGWLKEEKERKTKTKCRSILPVMFLVNAWKLDVANNIVNNICCSINISLLQTIWKVTFFNINIYSIPA